jgi:hypothetical protein
VIAGQADIDSEALYSVVCAMPPEAQRYYYQSVFANIPSGEELGEEESGLREILRQYEGRYSLTKMMGIVINVYEASSR